MPNKTSINKGKRPASLPRKVVPQRAQFNSLAEARELLQKAMAETDVAEQDLIEKAKRIEQATGRALEIVHETVGLCREVLMAGTLNDQWMPATFYEPWVGRSTLSKWCREGLPRKYAAQKLLIRPSDFFARLDQEATDEPPHGAANLHNQKKEEPTKGIQ
jgi:hypothetical protein